MANSAAWFCKVHGPWIMPIEWKRSYVKKNAFGFWIVLYNARFSLNHNPYVLLDSVS
jgi:hypothetical protein